MKAFKRFVFILLWAFLFFAIPALLAGVFIAMYLPEAPDPPTETAFMFVTCFSPISGICGLVFGLRRRLPGTK